MEFHWERLICATSLLPSRNFWVSAWAQRATAWLVRLHQFPFDRCRSGDRSLTFADCTPRVHYRTAQTGFDGSQPVPSVAECRHDKEAGYPRTPRGSQGSEANRAHRSATSIPSKRRIRTKPRSPAQKLILPEYDWSLNPLDKPQLHLFQPELHLHLLQQGKKRKQKPS